MQPKTQNINYEEYQEVSGFKNLGSVVTYNSDCGKMSKCELQLGIEATRFLKKL
jgi:hypothetical protein